MPSYKAPYISVSKWPKSRFECLPREIRYQIYDLLLVREFEHINLYSHNLHILRASRLETNQGFHPAILTVNSFISSEAYPFLYGRNTFFLIRVDEHKFNSVAASRDNAVSPCHFTDRCRSFIKHLVFVRAQDFDDKDAFCVKATAPKLKLFDLGFSPAHMWRLANLSVNVEAVASVMNIFSEKLCVCVYTARIMAIDVGSIVEVGSKKSKVVQCLNTLNTMLAAGVRPWRRLPSAEQDIVLVDIGVHVSQELAVGWDTYWETAQRATA